MTGYFTNHSLRATCASRMYDKKIPEQIIKETTGHRSECVQVYKRTSEELQEAASKTVLGQSSQKKIKIDCDSSDVEEDDDSKDIDFLSYEKMVENVRKTKEEMRKKLLPKTRLKARRLVKRTQRSLLDLNLNMNVRSKSDTDVSKKSKLCELHCKVM